jgi:hypothetical protein
VTSTAAGREHLLQTIDSQRLGCEMAGSPLYASLLEAVARDVASDGPAAELLAPLHDARLGDAVLLRLLAGLHLLVLEGQLPELARHFPSVGGHPGSDRALHRALRPALEAQRGRLAQLLQQGVQTNEVGRCAALVGGFLETARAGLPLRVLEVGASGGLNLLFDRYRYLDGAHAFGPEDSPLVFPSPWFGGAPDLSVPLEVAERRGCDPAPIDVADEGGRRRLRSFVWADQLDRLARLDAALEVAATAPPAIDAADAGAWVQEQLATPAAGVCTVVTHAIVFQYLSEQGRARILAAIDAAAHRATDDAPLAWLRLEPGGDQAELRLTMWPSGITRLLATSAYHGPPVVWRASGAPS